MLQVLRILSLLHEALHGGWNTKDVWKRVVQCNSCQPAKFQFPGHSSQSLLIRQSDAPMKVSWMQDRQREIAGPGKRWPSAANRQAVSWGAPRSAARSLGRPWRRRLRCAAARFQSTACAQESEAGDRAAPPGDPVAISGPAKRASASARSGPTAAPSAGRWARADALAAMHEAPVVARGGPRRGRGPRSSTPRRTGRRP